MTNQSKDFKPYQVVLIVIIMLALINGMTSCTANERAKHYGGSQTINLSEGERLVNVTWKGDNMWILTKSDPSSKPQTYSFKEKSSYGILQGEIEFIEK